MIILDFFKKYFVNFYIWWYWIKGREVIQNIWRFWLYMFIKLNVWPMLSNLFRPLYQDTSWTGRFVAFPIRLVWGGTGLVFQLVLLAVISVIILIYFIIPLVPLWQIGYYLFS